MRYLFIVCAAALFILFSAMTNERTDINSPFFVNIILADELAIKESAKLEIDTVRSRVRSIHEELLNNNGSPTQIKFEETSFDFGKLLTDEKVEHIFKFKNTGKSPLLILDAKAHSRWVLPEFSQEPIAPGEFGEILVKFDSYKKKGEIEIAIRIAGNTYPERITEIKIFAELPE